MQTMKTAPANSDIAPPVLPATAEEVARQYLPGPVNQPARDQAQAPCVRSAFPRVWNAPGLGFAA